MAVVSAVIVVLVAALALTAAQTPAAGHRRARAPSGPADQGRARASRRATSARARAAAPAASARQTTTTADDPCRRAGADRAADDGAAHRAGPGAPLRREPAAPDRGPAVAAVRAVLAGRQRRRHRAGASPATRSRIALPAVQRAATAPILVGLLQQAVRVLRPPHRAVTSPVAARPTASSFKATAADLDAQELRRSPSSTPPTARTRRASTQSSPAARSSSAANVPYCSPRPQMQRAATRTCGRTRWRTTGSSPASPRWCAAGSTGGNAEHAKATRSLQPARASSAIILQYLEADEPIDTGALSSGPSPPADRQADVVYCKEQSSDADQVNLAQTSTAILKMKSENVTHARLRLRDLRRAVPVGGGDEPGVLPRVGPLDVLGRTTSTSSTSLLAGTPSSARSILGVSVDPAHAQSGRNEPVLVDDRRRRARTLPTARTSWSTAAIFNIYRACSSSRSGIQIAGPNLTPETFAARPPADEVPVPDRRPDQGGRRRVPRQATTR